MTKFNKTQILTIVKHLAAGKSADLVAVIMKCTPSDIIDIAKHHGYPDVEKLAWAAEILEKKLEDDDQPTPSTLPTATTRPQTAQRPAAAPTPTVEAPLTRPDEIRILINTAKAHPAKRIQAQGNRVIDAIDRLRALIAEDQEKHAAKRAAEAEKAAARAEVERLEKQLAEAKAKLRGPAKPKKATAAKPDQDAAPTAEHVCRAGCDQAFGTPQGRSLHERRVHPEQKVA